MLQGRDILRISVMKYPQKSSVHWMTHSFGGYYFITYYARAHFRALLWWADVKMASMIPTSCNLSTGVWTDLRLLLWNRMWQRWWGTTFVMMEPKNITAVLLTNRLYCPLSLQALVKQAAFGDRLTWQKSEGGLWAVERGTEFCQQLCELGSWFFPISAFNETPSWHLGYDLVRDLQVEDPVKACSDSWPTETVR